VPRSQTEPRPQAGGGKSEKKSLSGFAVNNRIFTPKRQNERTSAFDGSDRKMSPAPARSNSLARVPMPTPNTKVSAKAMFNSVMHIDLSILDKEAKSLDVMLFHSRDRLVASLIRGITWSQWDHAMLFYRDQFTGTLFLMEAAQNTLNTGVQLIPFSRFGQIFDLYQKKYDKICYRRLTIPGGRTAKHLQRVDEFAKKVKGMSYGVGSLFSFFTFSEELHDNRTFFCSELCAAAYRYAGVLNESVSTASVYPGHFGAGVTLNLNDGASLGPEQEVVDLRPPDEKGLFGRIKSAPATCLPKSPARGGGGGVEGKASMGIRRGDSKCYTNASPLGNDAAVYEPFSEAEIDTDDDDDDHDYQDYDHRHHGHQEGIDKASRDYPPAPNTRPPREPSGVVSPPRQKLSFVFPGVGGGEGGEGGGGHASAAAAAAAAAAAVAAETPSSLVNHDDHHHADNDDGDDDDGGPAATAPDEAEGENPDPDRPAQAPRALEAPAPAPEKKEEPEKNTSDVAVDEAKT